MNPEQLAVKHFHQLIGAPAPDRPTMPSLERRKLRAELIREEAEEFSDAVGLTLIHGFDDEADEWLPYSEGDLIAAADALGDLLVVVYGAALELGLDMEPVFREIHRSNMTKGGGPVRADGKALKPATFSPPNLTPIIAAQQKGHSGNWIRQRDPGDETVAVLDAVVGPDGKISFTVRP